MSSIEILYCLLAELPNSKSSAAPLHLGSYSKKAGNFREISWMLVQREGKKLPKTGQRAYESDCFRIHLKRYNKILILCIVKASTPATAVLNFLHVVHSQYLLHAQQDSRRRRRRRQGPALETGLFDATSATAALLQRCMLWAQKPHQPLLLGTQTQTPRFQSSANVVLKRTSSGRGHNPNNNSDTGILLPMGFGDASALGRHDSGKHPKHPLDHVEERTKTAFLLQSSQAETYENYIVLLHQYRGILLNLILPNSKPTTEEQALKDACRETFVLNGAPLEGHRTAELMQHLATMIAPFAYSKEAIASTSLDVLRAASRTCTGGDSYFLTTSLFSRPGRMVTAGHVKTQQPIKIASTQHGKIVIESYNVYEIHDEEALMNGDGTVLPIISLCTHTIETIDCISGRANRILRITSLDIEDMVLSYQVKGAGIPGVNGKYYRQGVQLLYANMKGYFLKYQAIKEQTLKGGRINLEEHQWIIFRSNERLCYVCTVEEERDDDLSQGGWVVVKKNGLLPVPMVRIVARGYASVNEDEMESLFKTSGGGGGGGGGGGISLLEAGREGRTRREEGEQGQYKCDLLTGVSPPKPAFKVKDAQVASPGVAECMLPEKDCIVLGGAVKNLRRPSVVSQNSKIMSARDASRRRRRTQSLVEEGGGQSR